jgi:hypothetical protein
VEIHEEWQGSAHAAAFRSVAFLAHSDQGRIERCSSCHAPEPLGERAGRPLTARRESRDEGVHCISCHSVTASHGERASRALMVGPLGSDAAVTPHPIASQPERFRAAAFCGRCHEDTHREWVASAPPDTSSCQACHMPSVLRKVTQATGLVSGVLVSIEHQQPLRAHSFSSMAAVDESVRVLATDFLELRLAGTEAGVFVEIENLLPHSIPSGGFGGKRLALVIEVDGVEVARQELSNRPGKALGPHAVLDCEATLADGPHRIEGSLWRERMEASGDPVLLWKRTAEWNQGRHESQNVLTAKR